MKLLTIFSMLTNIMLEFGGPIIHMQCLKVQKALPISMFFVIYLKIHALLIFFAKRTVTGVVTYRLMLVEFSMPVWEEEGPNDILLQPLQLQFK